MHVYLKTRSLLHTMCRFVLNLTFRPGSGALVPLKDFNGSASSNQTTAFRVSV